MTTPIRVNQNGRKTILLATSQNQSVWAEVNQGDVNPMAYTAYGHLSAPRPASTHLGFNGELRDSHTHWYLLGNGYRAYNPALMRFHSPDKLSPFGAGGLNAYMYCVGDPINHRDPKGSFPIPTFVTRPLHFIGRLISVVSLGRRPNTIAQGISDTTTGHRRESAAQMIQDDPSPTYEPPPSFSSLDLRPSPSPSPPRAQTTIVPTHSNVGAAPSPTGRPVPNSGSAVTQEMLLNSPELVIVRMSELPQVQVVNGPNSEAKIIRDPKR